MQTINFHFNGPVIGGTKEDLVNALVPQITKALHSSYLIDDGLRVLFSHTYLGCQANGLISGNMSGGGLRCIGMVSGWA